MKSNSHESAPKRVSATAQKRVLFLARAALIAAFYAAITWLGNTVGIPAIGPVEFRFSEALAILPLFTSAAIPGLSIGCFLANLLCGGNVWDLVFGSLASLIGAVGTYLIGRWRPFSFIKAKAGEILNAVLGCFPPILANTLIIPPILIHAYGFLEPGMPVRVFYLIFLAGEAASVFIFGLILWAALKGVHLFREKSVKKQ